jgi:hypothetical protein
LILHIHRSLLEAGFRPWSLTSRIVADAIGAAFKNIGESAAIALIYHLARIHKLPEDVVVTRYDLVERSIKSIFGYGAEYILQRVREYLLHQTAEVNKELPTDVIIRNMQAKETTDFLRNLPMHEHIVFFHHDDNQKDLVLTSFFDSQVARAKGILLSKKLDLPTSVTARDYGQLFFGDKAASVKRFREWISSLDSPEGSGIRLAREEDSWFFANGFGKELMSLEESLSKHPREEMSVLCIYNLANLHVIPLQRILDSHSYVITDDPLMVYRWVGP